MKKKIEIGSLPQNHQFTPTDICDIPVGYQIYPTPETIGNLTVRGIITIYPTTMHGISHLSHEVTNIQRGEAELDIMSRVG